MHRVERKIAEAEDMLVYLASTEDIPERMREGLIPIVEATIDARKHLKALMLRGVEARTP